MSYLEIKFKIPTISEKTEILIAELAAAGFDSFMETEEGFNGYIEKDLFDNDVIIQVLESYKDEGIAYIASELENKNWNEEWEKNFDPVLVDDQVIIRASFHASPGFPIEIIINPKMSFGTGHHETTYMMVQNQLEIDHKDKMVMDAGSGTGVLAILACKLGAKQILAFDVEDWAFENLQENIKLNNCPIIQPAQGDITQVNHIADKYDIILANINKNVLLKEMSLYSRYLKLEGKLILSGFYESDIEDIQNSALTHSLNLVARKSRNRWASLVFQKA